MAFIASDLSTFSGMKMLKSLLLEDAAQGRLNNTDILMASYLYSLGVGSQYSSKVYATPSAEPLPAMPEKPHGNIENRRI